jgi:hypothetical protein
MRHDALLERDDEEEERETGEGGGAELLRRERVSKGIVFPGSVIRVKVKGIREGRKEERTHLHQQNNQADRCYCTQSASVVSQ